MPKDEKSVAFAPANISLVFQTYEATDDYGRGSLGVGFTLDQGVRATVSRARAAEHGSEIIVDGEPWEFPTVTGVLDRLAPDESLRVEIIHDFPFGCGFGMSAASALATAYATAKLLKLDASSRRLALAAHDSEVENQTGLGDVGGQFNGGFMIRTRKGHPLEVDHLPISERTVFWKVFGPISTSEVLGDAGALENVNRAGETAIKQIAEADNLDLAQTLRFSRGFARDAGLLQSPRVAAAIAECEQAGGAATMIMLGEAVVSSVPFDGATPARIESAPESKSVR